MSSGSPVGRRLPIGNDPDPKGEIKQIRQQVRAHLVEMDEELTREEVEHILRRGEQVIEGRPAVPVIYYLLFRIERLENTVSRILELWTEDQLSEEELASLADLLAR